VSADVEELELLRDATRGFLERHHQPAAVRAQLEGPRTLDRDAWRRAAEMGWIAAAVPELGGGVAQLAAIAPELGRATFPGPFLGCATAATLLSGATGARAAELLGALGDGTRTAALAVDAGSAEPGAAASVALDDGGRLSGELAVLADADVADVLLVPRATGLAHAVAADAPGVSVRPARGLDLTRRVATVTFDGTPAGPGLGLADGALRRALAVGATLAVADALGAAERLLELTVDYVGQRIAFGRPIGSYQAVKHKCADMLCWVDGTRVAVDAAAAALDGPDADAADAAVSVAKAYGADACARVAGEALQLHGGVAFTWEHDLHLLLRRIKADEVLFGDIARHERRLAARI